MTLEEHVSSGNPLPDHVVDHFRRMSEADVVMSAGVYGKRRREGREEEVQ